MKQHTFYVLAAITFILVAVAMFHSAQPTATVEAVGAGNAHVAPLATVDNTRDGQLVNVQAHYKPTATNPYKCIKYAHIMAVKGADGYSHTLSLYHGNCTTAKQANRHAQTVTATNPTDTTNPVIDNGGEDKSSNDKPVKNHCDNGNGNGAEGCNASDKGNQDETPQKGDKAENHPTKEGKSHK